jgi:mycofactocin precursor
MVDIEERERKDMKDESAENSDPDIIEEIEIEDFAVDGICGVY